MAAAARTRLRTVGVEVNGVQYHLALPEPARQDRHTTVLWDPVRETIELAHADPPGWAEPSPGAVVLGRLVIPGIGETAG